MNKLSEENERYKKENADLKQALPKCRKAQPMKGLGLLVPNHRLELDIPTQVTLPLLFSVP